MTIEYTAHIDENYPYLVRIGDNCTVAGHVRLLAYDAIVFKFTDGHTRVGKVELKDNCFIGERSIILPGVTIGRNALVAAGSVVKGDIPANSCVAGVPAKAYGRFDELIERHRQRIEQSDVFAYSELKSGEQSRERIWECVQNGDTYVRGYTGEYPYTLNGE